jgi:hypothetical protein
MSSNDLVYRSSREWRGAHGDSLACAKPGSDVCPEGFARQLTYGCSGVVYRDVPIVRSNAATQFTPAGKRYESKHAEHTPERVATTGIKRPRWTPERIAALPRTSGSLTRIGDELITGRNNNPFVPCVCSGSSPRCAKRTMVAASVYAGDSRPKGCKPCGHDRARRANAFTNKGYQTAREYVAADKTAAQEKAA